MKTKIFRITVHHPDEDLVQLTASELEDQIYSGYNAKVEDITDEVAEWKRDAETLEDQRMDNKFEKF